MAARIVPIECSYDTTGRVVIYYVDAPCPTLIDTGGAQHPDGPIQAALKARGTELAAIQAIINTHGHWDHAGGNAAVSATSGAGILIHEVGAPLLFDHRQHLDGYFTEGARALGQPALVAAQHASFPTIFGPEIVPNRLLSDGDKISLGDDIIFEVLHVPGHSDDAIALWWAEEGILIAGDAAQGTGSRPGACPLYFGSISQARASIARLRDLPFRTLHTSHFFGRPGHDDRASVYDAEAGRAFLDESLAAIDTMEAALHTALATHPDDDFPLLARAATEQLITLGQWPVTPDPLTGVPTNAAPTFYRLWREIAAV